MEDGVYKNNITVITPPSLLSVSANRSILVVADTLRTNEVIETFLEYWPENAPELYLYMVDGITTENIHWVNVYSKFCGNKIVMVHGDVAHSNTLACLWANDPNAWIVLEQTHKYGGELFETLLMQHTEKLFDSLSVLVPELIRNNLH